jgi:uncharacterized protein YcfL
MKKRLFIVFLMLLMAASLIGCSEQKTIQETTQKTVYETNMNGIALQVDTAKKTISDGKYTYQYELSGDKTSYNMTITYPNGGAFWWNGSESGGSGDWSDAYEEGIFVQKLYVRGNTLVDAVAAAEGLNETDAKQSNVGKVLIGLILIAFGIFELVAPETSWYLFRGWAYKNLEPSDAALTVARIGGGIAVFIGIGFLLPL